MEAEARARHIGYPPRKVRQVADLIRGKNVEEALEILKFTERAAAEPMSKTIKSAMHNMVNKKGGTVEAADMMIKSVLVDDGPDAVPDPAARPGTGVPDQEAEQPHQGSGGSHGESGTQGKGAHAREGKGQDKAQGQGHRKRVTTREAMTWGRRPTPSD